MTEEKHTSELNSVAAFHYQGLTMEQLLISVSIKQDQMLQQMYEMRKDMTDLKERKADKTEFTSYDARLTHDESSMERQEDRIDKLEKCKFWLIGVGAGAGALSGVVAALAIYILTKQ